jgi:hypothetical protein
MSFAADGKAWNPPFADLPSREQPAVERSRRIGWRASSWSRERGQVDYRIPASTSFVPLRRWDEAAGPTNLSRGRGRKSRRPAVDHIGFDVHENRSQVCILTADAELIEKRILIEASTESEWVARPIKIGT